MWLLHYISLRRNFLEGLEYSVYLYEYKSSLVIVLYFTPAYRLQRCIIVHVQLVLTKLTNNSAPENRNKDFACDRKSALQINNQIHRFTAI